MTCVEIRTSARKPRITSPSAKRRPEQPALKHHYIRNILVPAMKIIFWNKYKGHGAGYLSHRLTQSSLVHPLSPSILMLWRQTEISCVIIPHYKNRNCVCGSSEGSGRGSATFHPSYREQLDETYRERWTGHWWTHRPIVPRSWLKRQTRAVH